MKRYSVFLVRFVLIPMVGGPFVVSMGKPASLFEWLHAAFGFAAVYLVFGLLLLSVKHRELRVPAVAAVCLALAEAIPGMPRLHAAVSPLLFAALVWAASRAAAGKVTLRGKTGWMPLLPALVLPPIVFGVGYRHQTSGVVPHIALAMPAAGTLLIVAVVLNQRHPDNPALHRACNLTIAAVLFQVVAGAAALVIRMLDLESTLTLAIVRTAHITGAGPLLAASALLAINYRRI